MCDCGHPKDDHYRGVGKCLADVDRPEIGRVFGCFCPQFDPVLDPTDGRAA